MRVAIIGAGIAGLSVTRDLTLRGIDCVLIERFLPGSGTTTNCAGMLHSGARYAVRDEENSKLCFQENKIMRTIIPFAVGRQEGLFVVLESDAGEYEQKFLAETAHIGLPIKRLSRKEVIELEPNLGSSVIGGYLTPDTIIHTYLLVHAYLGELKQRVVRIVPNSFPTKIVRKADKWVVTVAQELNEQTETIAVDAVVNCAGAWISEVASLFGVNIKVKLFYGSMAVFNQRLSSRIISRCAPNSVGDVIVPIHDGSLVGSTWHERDSHDQVSMSSEDETAVKKTALKMIPVLGTMKAMSSFTSIRVHVSAQKEANAAFDHQRSYSILSHDAEGSGGCLTVLPGKLTTARYVAEKACDVLLEKFGVHTQSTTSITLLLFSENVLVYGSAFMSVFSTELKVL